MANTIRLRRGSGAPTAGSFVEGEPAWDSTNGKLYVKNAAGTMVQIGGSGGGAYTVSATAPSSPTSGDAWFDTSSGIEYVYLNDGTSSQWVETGAPGIGPQGASSDVTLAGANTFTSLNTFSQANQALSLTGSLNPATTSNGLLSVGTLGFSGSRMGANFTSSQTSYYQVVLQNTSNNAGASTDFVVCNDVSTDSTYYGNFGINSSTFTGSGALSAANAVYLTSTTGPLAIGTTTANDLRFVYNSETTDALTISANDATFGKTIKPPAGTATVAPLDFTAGTNLTTPIAGAIEYDGTHFYSTPTTTSGRGQISSRQTFRLTSNGTSITTIADYFGATSAINLAANSVYDIEMLAYLQKTTTAGTITWTLTASSAPTLISGLYRSGPLTGIVAGAPQTSYTGSRGATTAAFNATGSISNNAYMVYEFKVVVITNLTTTFKLQATAGAGSVTPQAGSFYTVRQIAGTTGSFA